MKLSNTGGLVLIPYCRQRGRKSAYANLQGAEVRIKSKAVTYYRPQRSWGKVMFLQASVILLTGGVCWPPPSRPPQSRHPPEQTTPKSRHPPRADPPWEWTPQSRHPTTPHPPWSRYPPPKTRHPTPQSRPPRADTPQEQTPPPPPPPEHSMLGNTVNVRAVRILPECNLVYHVKFR